MEQPFHLHFAAWARQSGLSQKQLASRLGWDPRRLSAILRGVRSASGSELVGAAALMQISLEQVLGHPSAFSWRSEREAWFRAQREYYPPVQKTGEERYRRARHQYPLAEELCGSLQRMAVPS